ncbi:iron-siderophore ABC transporter substrate-binding protein [Butyrivibrio sp. MC2013]|uniref:iron-siderophore ABC transporter substrate-binding protein n=1 Tax=Butyrivibrio sp. MC2013 TaxID=1280686 RepID=UPI00040B73B1|nr:iron-siderophore ABC transporter substrate-binding protein [Butyrivibrio sp. MC2013]
MRRFTNKTLSLAVITTILAAALTACSSAAEPAEDMESSSAVIEERTSDSVEELASDDGETGSEETAAGDDSADEQGTFPITVSHALGETVIEEEPRKVVTIGWGNLDVPLALGVAPVGVSKATYGLTEDNGLFSWTNNAFAELGVTEANVMDDTDGLDLEAINNAEPDLILAVYSGISQEDYEALSEIAPTVPYSKEAWATSWQDMTREGGRALGLEAEADKLVEDLEAMIDSKKAAYPDIEGKTGAYCYFDTSNLGSFYVYMPKDPRAAYLEDLGLELPDNIRDLDDGSFFFMTVSAENIDVLDDLDVLVAWGEEDTLDVLRADPLMSRIPAVERGSVVFLSNNSELIAASCTPTPLSIPATIDEYLEKINTAVAAAE